MSSIDVSDPTEKIPIDARLLSDSIIELNISRRNVSIYPREHPSVEKSLSRAYEFLQKLFELRSEMILAVAKDTLIIDNYFLDKKNPVYREFALQLSRMNIAYVTFLTGLTKDELYEFHRLISEKVSDTSVNAVQEMFAERKMIHIRAGFVDYGAFSFTEGKTDKDNTSGLLWERYVYGLLEGTLRTEDISDEIREISPDVLARLLNRTASDNLKEETYDRVITSYIRRSSESAFSGKDLKRLMDFINGLRPELKKQFLSSTVRTVSKDIDSASKALSQISVDEVIELLSTINDQKVALPDDLKNLLDKLSELPQNVFENINNESGLLVDDIFLSPDIVNLLGGGNLKAFITDAYQKEIHKLLDFDASAINPSMIKEINRECGDDSIEKDFNQTILELILSDVISEEDYAHFVNVVKEQTDQFMWTGQYDQILKILKVLEANAEKNRFSDVTAEIRQYYLSPEFISTLIDSFRILGRQMREKAWLLCEYYGDNIIKPLMDALIDEDSPTVRKFFMGLLKQFGTKIIPETLKHLGDSRWFVKRNMLYILCECNAQEILPHVRLYCRNENRKVSFEAVKCLLIGRDRYGIEALKDYLRSESREAVEQAISLSGAFRIREVVSDLIQMLRKKVLSGADLYEKMPVVKALGEIGDPRALDALKELLAGKSILFKGSSEKLKEEIYRTLKNYPYEDIKELIAAGLKSRNEYIRQESSHLSKSGIE
jgi:hypothetical protein